MIKLVFDPSFVWFESLSSFLWRENTEYKQNFQCPWNYGLLIAVFLSYTWHGSAPVCGVSAAAAAKSLQSCPTLCDPTDGSPLGSSVPGILQARTLEWVAISFSNAWKWRVKGKSLSCVQLLATPWTTAYQAPPFMGFSRQEYWSGVPLPSPCGVSVLLYYFQWKDFWIGIAW